MGKYIPKVHDRVRIAWMPPHSRYMIGATGRIAGVTDIYIFMDLDTPIDNQSIIGLDPDFARLEPIE